MNSRLTLAGICLLAAFGLAACGGGGGGGTAMDTAPPPDTGMMPPTDGTDDTDDGTEPMAPSVADLFTAAHDANTAADMAAAAAAKAVTDATAASITFDTRSAEGNSATAMANAQKVLDAQTAAGNAVTAAETALTDAQNALAEAMGIDDTDPNKATLINQLEAAVKNAEAQVTAAETSRDSPELKAAVALVQNPDNDDPAPDPLMTPADHAKTVADAIAAAIGPTGNIGTNAVPVTPGANQFVKSVTGDQVGETWEELAVSLGYTVVWQSVRNPETGTPIGVLGVRAVQINDKDAPADVVNAAEDGVVASRSEFTGVTMYGLTGTIKCSGGPCGVEGETGAEKLVSGEAGIDPNFGDYQGHWYFAPDNSRSTTMRYVANPDSTAAEETPYVVETAYATYGYWFEVAGGGAVTVNTFANPATGAGTGDVTGAASETLAASATYEGQAVGLSVHREYDTNNKQTGIASGEFTADVTLEATFGTDGTLSGTIDNFEGGSHVDSRWTVSLDEEDLNGPVTGGVAMGDGTAGVWTGTPYGPNAQRPVGITGRFNAHFTDGSAAGAYDARK